MFADRTRWNLEENRLSLALAEFRKNRAPILDLTCSNPTECGFAYDNANVQAAFRQLEVLRYVPDPRGVPSARKAICSYYQDRGISLDLGNLLLTSGTSEGYSFVFRLLCNPGDEVLIPSPGYPLFDFLADLCDVKLVRYPLLYDHGWQIDFSALAAAASDRTRAIIVVHPNNPTGHYASAAEQTSLIGFCTERSVALVADEVFLDFPTDKNDALSFAGHAEALAFTLSGLSKISGLPQMKLSWIAVNGPAQQKKDALARLEVIADTYLTVGTAVQLAAPALLGMRADFHAQVMVRIQNNLRKLDAQLARQSACNRLLCEGGWSAVLRVPAVQLDEDLAISLLTRKGVSVHPGHFYDFPQPGYIVISLIVPEKEFEEGIRRVLSYFV